MSRRRWLARSSGCWTFRKSECRWSGARGRRWSACTGGMLSRGSRGPCMKSYWPRRDADKRGSGKLLSEDGVVETAEEGVAEGRGQLGERGHGFDGGRAARDVGAGGGGVCEMKVQEH